MTRRTRTRKMVVNARTTKQAIRNVKRAGRNMRQAGDLTAAAGRVIAARSAMAVNAMTDPTGANMDEFARLIPEKVSAFSASGAAGAGDALRAFTTLAGAVTAEWFAAAGRTAAVIGSARTPYDAALAHGQNALASWQWLVGQSVSIGASILRAQGAMTAPLQAAAEANARRLVAAK